PLRQAPADRRRRLERRARVAEHHVEPVDRRDAVDDGPAVRAHHDHPRPAAAHRGASERGEARRELRAAERHVLAVDRLVVVVGVGVAGAELHADQRRGAAFGAHPGLVERVDDGGIPPDQARRPAEDRDLDPVGHEAEVEPEQLEKPAAQAPGTRTTTGAATRPSRVSTPTTRPRSTTTLVTSRAVSILAPPRIAAAANAKAVAFGSAKPDSGSHAAPPTSSVLAPGSRRGRSSGETSSVLIPMRCCIATLRRRWSS